MLCKYLLMHSKFKFYLLELVQFFKIIFDLQVVKSTDVKPVGTEGCLHSGYLPCMDYTQGNTFSSDLFSF